MAMSVINATIAGASETNYAFLLPKAVLATWSNKLVDPQNNDPYVTLSVLTDSLIGGGMAEDQAKGEAQRMWSANPVLAKALALQIVTAAIAAGLS